MKIGPSIFEEDNPFLEMISGDLLETSVAVANRWKEEFVVSEDQRIPMIWCSFNSQRRGGPFLLFGCLTETLTHLGGEWIIRLS